MPLPILPIAQALMTIMPLFGKDKSLSQKAEAKQALSENNGPISSSVGVAAIAAAVTMAPQVDSLESAIAPLVSAIVGLICYFIRAK